MSEGRIALASAELDVIHARERLGILIDRGERMLTDGRVIDERMRSRIELHLWAARVMVEELGRARRAR